MFDSQQQNDAEHINQPAYSEDIAIKNLSEQSNPSDQYYAAWWLGRMRSRHPQAIPGLLNKLTILRQEHINLEQRGVALNAIRALGKLGAIDAVEPLIELLQCSDIQIQTEAARSLGTLKANQAIPFLISILQSIQTNRTDKDPSNELQIAVIRAIGAIGARQPTAVDTIKDLAKHPIPLLRSASCSALVRLTDDPSWTQPMIALLNNSEPLVRRGALLDLGACGHLQGLDAIQTAAVESSLKLIALKMLAESTASELIFNAMDELL